ncbi:disease resistance protein At4g27190-like isoform X2 [Durio zibethinus]|uniref:Disease resistance protein At4g27190-like isoform X2 n=1 Tax=Durio zibethinus TaxID=66656 RepID=A0A6P5Z977_DURZI|nr:disease resistance protein At4g27190-like isoform X2 [Durio zibethinus]
MEVLGSILEIVRIIWDPIGKCFKYHRSVEKYMMILHKKMEELNSRREDIESRLNIELHSGKTLKKEVKLWLDSVQKVTSELHTISQEVGERKYLSRAHLGKKISFKIQLVEELHQKGAFGDRLVTDAPPGNKDILPTTELVGETTVRSKIEEIWNCLMDDNYRKIGVYGMGGVGKTTMIKHIHNKLIKETNKFDNVILVSVSKSTSVTQLQDKVAHALGVCMSENESEMIRAAELFAMMGTMRKYILILDDVWEEFQLEDVGIPEPTADNESKFILTTRLADVCFRMGCKRIKAELLTEEEAWTLFVEKAGCNIISPHIKAIAKEVARECACLPLAIVTIARSMKGVTESCEWRNALEELRDSTRGHHDMRRVLEQLKFSYNHLDDEKHRHCLLYCALYPEDLDIGRKELIERLIAGGVIDGMSSRQAAFDKGHAMLNKLEKACLLECVTDKNENNKRVKMHDLIRDMVHHVTDISSHLMVKAGLHLREIPNETYWTEDLEMVSLMHNYISEIPSNASPMCPRLSTLLLSSNHCLRRIPDPFFLHMGTLQVLDLSDTSIEVLPNSISKLEKLTALLLRRCARLRCVPPLDKLIFLRKLDLCHAGIKEIPQGLEMLVSLRYLNLYTPHLEFLPCGSLSKLLNLQVLITYGASKTLKVKGEEVAGLKKLEMFSGQFYSMQDFNRYVHSISTRGREPHMYSIRVGESHAVTVEEEQESFGKHVKLVKCFIGRGHDELCLPNGIQTLDMYDCHGVASLCEISSLNNATDLRSCEITKCADVKCAFQASSSIPLQSLESLRLIDLLNFVSLSYKVGAVTLPDGTFRNLKSFLISRCPNIIRLFTPSLLLQLHNLSVLEVSFCPEMEEIVAKEHEEDHGESINEDTATTNHPMLRHLFFCELPKLKSIYVGILRCESLQVIEIYGCPRLNRLPFSLYLVPSNLEKISATEEWWESLEWDQPNAKSAFQPFFKNCLPHRIRFRNRSI